MNYSIIFYIVGMILNLEAVLMVLPGVTAIIYGEKAGFAFLITIAICLAIGIPVSVKTSRKQVFYAREGFVAVALSWITLSIIGAVPFVLTGSIPNPIDALFETVSGFTTTGASILTDVEVLPHSVLIWRSFTHWIGGMGVLVFVLAILPLTGGYHMALMKAESPGPSVSRMLPTVQSTAKVLYAIYIGLTVTQILLMLITGMPLFDALCISFGTAGTGGFGVLNASCGSYTTIQQIIITVFMILFGINFNVYFLALMKQFGQAVRVEELRYYLGIIGAAILAITINTVHLFSNVGEAIQQVSFQVGSIITTTGYSTADFDQWPVFSKTILVMLMFIGACAGSTGGGIKVSRIMILIKSVGKEMMLFLHPNAIKKIKIDQKPVAHEVVRSTNIFIIVYVVIFAFSTLIISIDNFSFTTNFTAVAATLNNIGPGLEMVGPTGNYSLFSGFSKLILTFDMLAGRLEIFPLMMLFYYKTWKKV